MRCSWDKAKAARNLALHDVSFEEAATVFYDPLFLIFADLTHSFQEKRFIMGESDRQRLLAVAYTERREAIRIISARNATRKEREVYEEEV
jgi:uncharacterized protein